MSGETPSRLLPADSTGVLLLTEIPGTPRPQGSMKMMTNRATGKGFLKYSNTTVDHRNLVVSVLAAAWPGEPYLGPVAVRVTFEFARPGSHYGTGKNAAYIKDSAPVWHSQTPDVDKCLRLVCDALTVAGVVRDDRQVALTRAAKTWAAQDRTRLEVLAL